MWILFGGVFLRLAIGKYLCCHAMGLHQGGIGLIWLWFIYLLSSGPMKSVGLKKLDWKQSAWKTCMLGGNRHWTVSVGDGWWEQKTKIRKHPQTMFLWCHYSDDVGTSVLEGDFFPCVQQCNICICMWCFGLTSFCVEWAVGWCKKSKGKCAHNALQCNPLHTVHAKFYLFVIYDLISLLPLSISAREWVRK